MDVIEKRPMHRTCLGDLDSAEDTRDGIFNLPRARCLSDVQNIPKVRPHDLSHPGALCPLDPLHLEGLRPQDKLHLGAAPQTPAVASLHDYNIRR